MYKARHAFLRRPTAVKVLDGVRTDRTAIARFEREVQVTSSLTHPNTVEIYDYGRTEDDVFFFAMEYLPGVTLEALVRREGRICRPACCTFSDKCSDPWPKLMRWDWCTATSNRRT